MNGRRQSRAAGFSVIDAMATLTLLALVSTIATPVARSYVDAARLRGAAWTLASDLQRARQRAISENRSHRLTLSPSEIDPQSGLSLAYDIAPAATGTPAERHPLPSGVLPLNAPGTWVEFNSRGLAATGVQFQLRGATGGIATVRVRSTGQVDLSG